MALEINTNTSSLAARGHMESSQKSIESAFARIASGIRINKANEDPAGLAVAINLTSQIQGLSQAERNANDAISTAQVAEGSLREATNILQRGRELALQAANGTNTAIDRQAIQSEVNQLQQQLNQIVDTANFNGVKLFDGNVTLDFQVGAQANEEITVNLSNPIDGLGQIDVTSDSGAQAAIASFDNALEQITTQQADLGAVQNRLASTLDNLRSSNEAQQSARSRILDADIAKETSELVKNQILNQASIAALGQANTTQQNALTLLSTIGGGS